MRVHYLRTCRCESFECSSSFRKYKWNERSRLIEIKGYAFYSKRDDSSRESGRFNVAMLEDTSSRASSYFRGYKTRRTRRFRRELAYGWNRTWYPRCLHRSWNGYPRWKRRSPFRIGLYPCKSYERAVAQSPRRGIQAAARVGVYADVIDHVSALFLRDICIIGKIVSILFRNDPTRSLYLCCWWIPV